MRLKPWIIISAVLLLAFNGCDRGEKFGTTDFDEKTVSVKEILTSPEAFHEKVVTIEGKIVRECPTGCWFDLQEDSAIIYVDTKASGFGIPQRVGKRVTVKGTVRTGKGQTMIVGKGVEIK